MNIYNTLKNDMNVALKSGDKLKRMVLADIVATIDRTATAGKTRLEITDNLCNEVLIKYQKTVQEMIDTCPADRAATLEDYQSRMTIVKEYAPQIIDNPKEIENIIRQICSENNISIEGNKTLIKQVMPYLKNTNCDKRIAQTVIKNLI